MPLSTSMAAPTIWKTSFLSSSFSFVSIGVHSWFNSLQPFAESRQTVVRARNHLHAHHRADLRRGGGAGVSCCFHAGDIAAEKRSYVAAADFFPTGEVHVRG